MKSKVMKREDIALEMRSVRIKLKLAIDDLNRLANSATAQDYDIPDQIGSALGSINSAMGPINYIIKNKDKCGY